MPQYHIGLTQGQIGRYIFLVEKPDDAPRFASFLDGAKEVANHREYCSYTGKLDGVDVTIISTGIGGPSTAIAIEELAVIGAEVFIFTGFCTSNDSAFIVATGAFRDEGTGLQYMPLEVPALADLHTSDHLKQVCLKKKCDFQDGIVHSRDAFFQVGYDDSNANGGNETTYPGIIALDMNSATTFIVSHVLSKKAGAILACADQEGKLKKVHIEIAIDAMKSIIGSNSTEAKR
jgi:uridine phosphorylase